MNRLLALLPQQGVQAQGQAIDGAFNTYYQAQQNRRGNQLLDLQEQNAAFNQERGNALLDIQEAQNTRAQEAHDFQMNEAEGARLYKVFQVLSGLDPEQRMTQIELMKDGLRKRGFDDDDWEMLATDEGLAQGQKALSAYAPDPSENSASDPASVREYQFFNNLSDQEKEAYLTMKRANPTYKFGDVPMRGNQLSPTASAVTEGATTSQEEAQKTITKQAATKAATTKAAETAIKKSEEAFDKIAPIRQNISNYDEAMRLIDEGAETGVVAARLPSVKQASIELDNLQGKLGLDVIGNTTFGALSEAELRFALSTALPKNLEGPALKSWLQRKKASQQKLLAYTERAATFLGTPGNTLADWVSLQRSEALERVPPEALDYLTKNPQDAEFFQDKYGVLPDGF